MLSTILVKETLAQAFPVDFRNFQEQIFNKTVPGVQFCLIVLEQVKQRD